MGKGDKDRTRNKKQYDINFDMIYRDEEIVKSFPSKEQIICGICNLPITPYELATFNNEGTCHSGCVFAPGER